MGISAVEWKRRPDCEVRGIPGTRFVNFRIQGHGLAVMSLIDRSSVTISRCLARSLAVV
jgi:hypothetical protein